MFSLFITSYVPLFAIVIGKQIKEGWNYLCWGGWNREALICFFKHFGMSAVLVVVSVVGSDRLHSDIHCAICSK